ncbi:hypothetical protein DYB32_009998 [Aphanomyces invadans]|uniref:Secreted protein n=1 Tax=Aphanomyces invadans TaxID=157072 RepID=A0A3R6YRT0_9STRA|nr:hypothetical protein DYB32_009998 [Aphanomyces invadans]
MKLTLVSALVLAAVANVAALDESVPTGLVKFDHGLVVSAPAESAAVESADATNLVAIVQDFEKFVHKGMQDFQTIMSLVDQIRNIAMMGLNPTNGQQFVAAIEIAIQRDDLRVKDGKDLLKDIKDIVARGHIAGPQAVADIMKVFQGGMKLTTVADLISDLQKVIQNASKDVDTTLKLVNVLQRIQSEGITLFNFPLLALQIQPLISAGSLFVKDAANLVRTIQIIAKNGISLRDSILVLDAILTALQEALAPFDTNRMVCRRSGEGRGVGTVFEIQCKEDEEAYGALCYPKCREGYEKVGCCICRKKGCSGVEGVTDIGVSCTKPAAYGRGAGYALWQEDKCKNENGGTCEKNGLMWYPQCKDGFHPVGCCICSPDCPDGTTDDGAFCRKDWYSVGVGVSRWGCPAGKEKSGALCYPPCALDFIGSGPVCLPKCNGATPFHCGLFCTSSATTCFTSSIQVVGSAVKVALNLLDEDFSGAAAGVAQGSNNIIQISHCQSNIATPP